MKICLSFILILFSIFCVLSRNTRTRKHRKNNDLELSLLEKQNYNTLPVYGRSDSAPPPRTPLYANQLELPLRQNAGVNDIPKKSFTRFGNQEEALDTGGFSLVKNTEMAKQIARKALGHIGFVNPEIVPQSELPYDLNVVRNEGKSPTRYSKWSKTEVNEKKDHSKFGYHYNERAHAHYLNALEFGKHSVKHKHKNSYGKTVRDDKLVHHDKHGFPKHFNQANGKSRMYMGEANSHNLFEADGKEAAFLEKKSRKTHKMHKKWPFHVRTAIGRYAPPPDRQKMVPKRVPPKFAPLYGRPGEISTAANDVAPHPLVNGLEDAPAVPFKTHSVGGGVKPERNAKTLVGVHRPRNSNGTVVGVRRPNESLKRGGSGFGPLAISHNDFPSGNRYFKIPKAIRKIKILPKRLSRHH